MATIVVTTDPKDPTGNTLLNPGTTLLGTHSSDPEFDTAHWIVGPGVESFLLEPKSTAGSYPFDSPLPTTYLPEVTLTTEGGITHSIGWDYKISWKHPSGAPGTPLDPKIAVDPGIGFHDFFFRKSGLGALAIGLAAGMLGFFSAKFLFEKSQEKNIFKK